MLDRLFTATYGRGMVSGTSTQNGGPSPLDYDYVYDYLWRILRAGPPASDSWGEKGISYDRNGNLRSLTRYGGDGSVTDMLNMSYIGNVLAGVTHNGVTKLYSHDVGGRLTEDGRTGVSVSYDVTGMPLRTRASAQTSPGTEAVHSYLSDGTRLGVSMTLGTGHLQVRSGYVNYGSLTFREIGSHQSFESSLFGGGVILSDGVRYFTRDHLGNTRVVTDASGGIVERDDYYPFGERHEDSSMPTTATNRWRFAGKEIQPLGSTGWIDFGARQYDSFLGRWTTVDPLAEKYPGLSPYLYCAGNPVNYVDRSGQFPETLWDIANVVMDVKSLATNIAVGNVGGAIVDGIGLIADVASVALPGVPGGAGTAIKAARGGDLAVDAIRAADKAEKAVSAGKYGSYTITFESGKKYHDKGPVSRMEQSAREKSKKYSDPVVSKDWVPSPTERDAFIDEAKRIRDDGGVKSPTNYNLINSPGEKFLK